MNSEKSKPLNILWLGFGDLATRCQPLLINDAHKLVGVARSRKNSPAEVVEKVDQSAGAQVETQVDAERDANIDAKSDAKVDAGIDAKIDAKTCVRMIRGAIQDDDVAEKIDQFQTDIAIISLSPSGRTENDYREAYLDNVEALLNLWAQAKNPPKQVIYISSTRVYAQNEGQWINERSEVLAESGPAKILRQAELALESSAIPSLCLRFSGIYGRESSYLVDQVKAGIAGNTAYTNRIHIDDCVGIIHFLVSTFSAGGALPEYLLASDCEPVTAKFLREYIAGQLGLDSAALIVSGRGEGAKVGKAKRCDNTLLRALGYVFKYPSYQDGYR
ncbi:MAG: nucleoside-diphosphate-sugar epimerase [Flavobacteriales bacterium]